MPAPDPGYDFGFVIPPSCETRLKPILRTRRGRWVSK